MNPIGVLGEDIACSYLSGRGYRILKSNVQVGFGEIDIICRYKDLLIMVEVKTISKRDSYNPEDHFDERKQRKVQQLAHYFVNKYPEYYNQKTGWRIDLIAIEYQDAASGEYELHHYEAVI